MLNMPNGTLLEGVGNECTLFNVDLSQVIKIAAL